MPIVVVKSFARKPTVIVTGGVMKTMSKIRCFLAALGMVMLLSGIAMADGKDVFETKCGSCHRSGGEAAVLAPTKYASAQWDRFFDRDKHSRKKDISAEVSPADISQVREYLIAHAADSDQPEAIGLK